MFSLKTLERFCVFVFLPFNSLQTLWTNDLATLRKREISKFLFSTFIIIITESLFIYICMFLLYSVFPYFASPKNIYSTATIKVCCLIFHIGFKNSNGNEVRVDGVGLLTENGVLIPNRSLNKPIGNICPEFLWSTRHSFVFFTAVSYEEIRNHLILTRKCSFFLACWKCINGGATQLRS